MTPSEQAAPVGLTLSYTISTYTSGVGLAGRSSKHTLVNRRGSLHFCQRPLSQRAPASVVCVSTSDGKRTGAGSSTLRPKATNRTCRPASFQAFNEPLCIGIFGRAGDVRRDEAARSALFLYGVIATTSSHDLPSSTRAMGSGWFVQTSGPSSFRPKPTSDWRSYPSLKDVVPWSSPGIKPNRTWVYAPNRRRSALMATLAARRRRRSRGPDEGNARPQSAHATSCGVRQFGESSVADDRTTASADRSPGVF